VTASLKAAGVTWVELGGVKPNPKLDLVYEGIKLCREHKLELVLAVGGGSVIDSAKAIAAGVPYTGDVWDFFTGKASVQAALAVATVLTIPAAGSETSGSTVISRDEGSWKKPLTNNDFLRPVFSILNPELTTTLPRFETAVGAADIMSHVFERYFTRTPHVDFIDRLSEATLRSVIHNLPLVLAEPTNYDHRAELMWTGTIAHNDLLGTGRDQDWATHNLEHELSGLYDVPHGAGLAVLFPAWMKYVYQSDPLRFAQFAERVWGVEPDHRNPERTAREGIARLQAFWSSCGLPSTLEELGVPTDRFEEMARKATADGAYTNGNFRVLAQNDIVEIYRLARREQK
jgi:alcohol dehydrogenase YqhD (iron-dependent ADH family)